MYMYTLCYSVRTYMYMYIMVLQLLGTIDELQAIGETPSVPVPVSSGPVHTGQPTAPRDHAGTASVHVTLPDTAAVASHTSGGSTLHKQTLAVLEERGSPTHSVEPLASNLGGVSHFPTQLVSLKPPPAVGTQYGSDAGGGDGAGGGGGVNVAGRVSRGTLPRGQVHFSDAKQPPRSISYQDERYR